MVPTGLFSLTAMASQYIFTVLVSLTIILRVVASAPNDEFVGLLEPGTSETYLAFDQFSPILLY
jgi:hypothetical protein